MNSENVPKEIGKLFIDLANMAKGLLDENKQPFVQQEFERLFSSTKGGEWGGKSRDEIKVGFVQVNHSASTTIQILVLQHRLSQNGRLQKYGDQKLDSW